MGVEKVVRCLSNSFSRFIHLVTFGVPKNLPCQKDYKDVANLLKLFKRILDNIDESHIHSDEILFKEFEELDLAINEAREFIENWGSHMSKIYGIMQSRQVIVKIQSYSIKICQTVYRLLESSSSSSTSTSTLADIQHFMEEFENLKLEIASEKLDEALKCVSEGKVPPLEHLIEIIELLNLSTSQELIKESIAVENENIKLNESDQINQITNLVFHIRETMVNQSLKAINGVRIPSYFICPLSLQLMFDPVIIASGQTYERDSIQKWLNNGLNRCPVTRHTLSHTNLIPNYTVKALIANWCDENDIKVNQTSDQREKAQDSAPSELIQMVSDIDPSLQNTHLTPRSSFEVEKGFDQKSNHIKVNQTFDQPEKAQDSAHGELIQMVSDFDPSLQNTHLTPRSSFEVENGFNRKSNHPSPEESCSHSRSGSTSTAVSSETASDCNITSGFSPWLSGKQHLSSNNMDEIVANGGIRNYPRTISLPTSSSPNDLTTSAHVQQLVNDLTSPSNETQTKAASELRFLAKHNMENRIIIGESGAIQPLLSLLHSNSKLTQEHAVTALLNMSINGNIKSMIAESGAIEPLIFVLETGNTCAKENAAAALFSLSLLEEYRVKIGQSGAVKPLVDLLESGTLRGKKDAATALFNLSIFHENKARIIQAGAVKYLVELMDPATEMVDKSVALLSNLSTISEGCLAIAREGGIPLLVEVVETGSQRGKENAASILLQLCLNSPKYCRLVLQEGAVPPLVALSQSGTSRAKEKAQQLLSHFRSQREKASGRGKS